MSEELSGTVEGAGGVRLSYRGRAAPRSRGRLLAVHGLGDHSGRFGRLADAAVGAGLDFYALDLRGHGRSEGVRGHAASFDRLLQDLDRFRRKAHADTAGRPTFLLGHSLGALIVGRYVQEFGFPELAGAVLAAPFLDLAMAPPAWKLRFAGVADRVLPRVRLGNGIRVEDQFREAVERERWESDPLVHDRITPRLWSEMRRNAAVFRERSGGLGVPMLVLIAGEDRIVSSAAARGAASAFGGRVEVREYPGAFHTLFQDPSTGHVVEDTVEWIVTRLAVPPGASGTALV